jgi:hypothetical protein
MGFSGYREAAGFRRRVMSLKKCIGLVSMAALGGALVVGCSSSSNSGNNNNPTDSGTSTTDASHPGTHPDASPVSGDDSSTPGDDGGSAACAPADETGFKPTWHAAKPAASQCTQAQIDAYHQCLKDGQTQQSPASCAPFGTNATTANKNCVTCILTQDTAAAYGPIVVHKGTIEMNVPGCLAVATNDPQGTGCAGKYQAASECRLASCAANCPVTDDASFQAEQSCEQAAAAGTCKSFEDAAACADGLVEAGGAPAACLSGQSFDDLYNAIVPIFCGGAAAADGGSNDAATDAAGGG